MNLEPKTLKKIAIIGGAILIILVAIGIFFAVDNAQKTATLKILVAPSSAEISINGTKYSNGTHNIKPGTYTATISKQGFETQTLEFEAKKDEESHVYLYLEQTDGGDWYSENEGDALIVGSIQSYYSTQKIQELYKQNPLTSILPIKVDYYFNNYASHVKYTISYQVQSDNETIQIIITDYTGGNYDAAIANLENHKIDPGAYEIKYDDQSSQNSGGHAF